MRTKPQPVAGRRPGRPRQPHRQDVDRALGGLTRAQLVGLFGVSPATFDRWRSEGLPERDDGRYDLAAVMRWARGVWLEAKRTADGGRDGREQLGRLRAVRVAREALALQRDRGLVMTRETVLEEWARRCFAFRNASLALPRLIAARCAQSQADVVEREAAAIVREMLLNFVRRAGPTPTPPGFEEELDVAVPASPPSAQASTTPPPTGIPTTPEPEAAGTSPARPAGHRPKGT